MKKYFIIIIILIGCFILPIKEVLSCGCNGEYTLHDGCIPVRPVLPVYPYPVYVSPSTPYYIPNRRREYRRGYRRYNPSYNHYSFGFRYNGYNGYNPYTSFHFGIEGIE